MIEASGGYFSPPDNLRNRESLEYILDAIENPIFGTCIFPTITEKAAALAHNIIVSHVFFDGNKRTAMHTAWMFLQSNGVNMQPDSTVEDIALGIATGTSTRSDLCSWLHEKTRTDRS
jgi:death-on-curing protein